MTADQAKSLSRAVMVFAGAILATFGVIDRDQAALLLNPDIIASGGLLLSAVGGLWGQRAHTKANMVATVAAMPEVDKVTTASTPAGDALADSVPSPSVEKKQ